MKLFAKIALAVVVVVAAVAAASYALLSGVDFNRYRATIAESVRDATGRELTIRGDISPRIGWSPTVAVEGVRLANAPWADSRPMVDVGAFEVQFQLWPLLVSFGRDIVVDRVVLRDATVLLETNAKGKGNWDFEEAGGDDTAGDEGGDSGDALPFQLDVRDAVLERVTVSYAAGGGKPRVLRFENLGLHSAGPRREIDAAGSYGDLAFTLGGTLGTTADFSEGPLPVDVVVGLGDRGSIAIAGDVLEPAAAAGYSLTVTAELPEVSGIDGILRDAGLDEAGLPPLGPLRARIEIHDTESNGRMALPSVDVEVGRAGSTRLHVKGSVGDPLAMTATPPGSPGLDLVLAGDGPDVSVLLGSASAPGDGASRAWKAGARLADRGTDTFTVRDLDVRAAGSDVTGEASIKLGKTPELSATLRSQAIDLVALFGPGTGGDAAPAPGKAARLFPSDPLPLDALASAAATVELSVSRLVFAESMPVDDVALTATLRGGKLAVGPLRAGIGGGIVKGELSLSAQGAFATRLEVRGVDLGTLLAQGGGGTQVRGGRTDADVDVRGRGASVREIMAGLDGKVFVHVGNGTVRTAYLGNLGLNGLLALLDKSLAREEDVKLNCVVSRIDVAGGKADHRTLVVDTSRLAMIGRGRTNLADESLDLHVDTKAKIPSLLSALPPILVKGTLASPRFAPDPVGVVSGAAGALARTPGAALGTAGDLAEGLLGAVSGRPGGNWELTEDVCAAALAGRPLKKTGVVPTPRREQPAPDEEKKPGIRIPVLPELFGR